MSSSALFDTSAVIGLLERRSTDLIALVTDLDRPIVRSTTVCGELRHGVGLSDRDPIESRRSQTLHEYLSLSVWPDVEFELDELSELYGAVSATSAQPELRAGMNDRWVIAECLAYRSGLVTGDQRQARLAGAAAATAGISLDVTLVDSLG